MRMMHYLFFVAAIFLVGCDGDGYGPIVDRVDRIIMADPGNVEREDWPDGHYTILGASITDDILMLRVELMESGETDFDLVCWNYWMESNPVQAYAFLACPESDDAKIIIERELLFDLTPMKESYLTSYPEPYPVPGAQNVVILRFRDSHHPQPNSAWLYYEF